MLRRHSTFVCFLLVCSAPSGRSNLSWDRSTDRSETSENSADRSETDRYDHLELARLEPVRDLHLLQKRTHRLRDFVICYMFLAHPLKEALMKALMNAYLMNAFRKAPKSISVQ